LPARQKHLLQNFSENLKFEVSSLQEGLAAVILLLCCFAAVFAVAAIKIDLERARKVLLWARRLFIFAAGLAVLLRTV
jgi:hypothetical protein